MDLVQAIGLGTGISAWFGILAVAYRYGQLNLKVETMWEFMLRRGVSELTQRGLGHMNSPVIVTAAAKEMMIGLAPDLHAFYAARFLHSARLPTDVELAAEIEHHFGERILKEFCIPNGIYEGACLLIAMAIAREGGKAQECDTAH